MSEAHNKNKMKIKAIQLFKKINNIKITLVEQPKQTILSS